MTMFKKSYLFIATGLIGIAVLTVVFLPSFIQEKKIAHIREFVSDKDTKTNNIADEWEWDNFSDEDVNAAIKKAEDREKQPQDSMEKTSFEFDVVVVYSALATVGIDESGDVIVDSKALEALENAFAKLPEELTESELEELLQLIKTGLPGAAGEQTAAIVDSFQRYKNAERDFNAVMPEPKTADEALAMFDQKVALRESILGLDVADKLFSQEQAQSRYMLQLMAISGDKSLSDDEKKIQIETLKSESDLLTNNYSMKNPRNEEMVEENVVILRQQGADEAQISAYRYEHLGEEKASLIAKKEDIERKQSIEWEKKYESFSYEKQRIIAAELAPADEKAQIEELLKEHYKESELDKARTYDSSQGNLNAVNDL